MKPPQLLSQGSLIMVGRTVNQAGSEGLSKTKAETSLLQAIRFFYLLIRNNTMGVARKNTVVADRLQPADYTGKTRLMSKTNYSGKFANASLTAGEYGATLVF